MKTSIFACCLGLLFTASTFLAQAATITVTNTNDDGTGSLRAAIAAASPGDTIVFALTYPATITLSNTLSITQNLTIQGPGASHLAISGNHAVEVFSVGPGVIAALSRLTIEGGDDTTGSDVGGGIYNAGTLTLTNSTVSDNYSGSGGGIYNAGTLTLTNTIVSSNLATVGGGVWNAGTLTITFSTFSNYAEASGAGIWNGGGTVTVSNSTFSDNAIDDFCGGGIDNQGGALTVTNSTFSDNYASCGGGIENGGGALTVTNSTFSGNSADVGGGIDNCCGALTVTNSTFSGNSATVGGGISGTVNLKNTILANSFSGGNCSGTAISGGHNLSDDASCDFTGVGDLNSTPAGLDPAGLQNNGGPTQTIALLATSPAVDAIPLSPINYCTLTDGVTPVATDQRGVIRPQLQNCDMGAYEFATANSMLVALQSQIEKSIPDGDRTDKLELKHASAQLSAALAPQNWTGSDGNHIDPNRALQFFLEEEAAAWNLTLVLMDKQSHIPPQEVRIDLDNLALANRILATVAIADAAGGNRHLLSLASAQLAAGDQALAAGNYNAAIIHYAVAWAYAESAH
jgi:hypothetical protein